MRLIIDIGNTSAKLAVFDENKLLEVFHSSNQSLDCLDDICTKYNVISAIVCSVIDLSEKIENQLNSLDLKLVFFTHQTPIPITNSYKSKETLGMDRLAAIIGANEIFPNRDILVIDAGTCITYDFINKDEIFIGGNITPGLMIRLKSLNHFTGKLPLVDAVGEVLDLGNDTQTAIRSGVIQGIKHEIAGFIYEMQKKNKNLLVFLTGGDDFSFDTKLKSIIFADRFLVLKGLNRILKNNDKL